MTKKIFRNCLAVGIWVFVLSVALFMGMLYQYFTDQLASELETEANLVAQGVEQMGMDYFDGLRSENRITWVERDGTVLYDNTVDAASMETMGTGRRSKRQCWPAMERPGGSRPLCLSAPSMWPSGWRTGR